MQQNSVLFNFLETIIPFHKKKSISSFLPNALLFIPKFSQSKMAANAIGISNVEWHCVEKFAFLLTQSYCSSHSSQTPTRGTGRRDDSKQQPGDWGDVRWGDVWEAVHVLLFHPSVRSKHAGIAFTEMTNGTFPFPSGWKMPRDQRF